MFHVLHVKFSIIRNCGTWSETEAAMLPEVYLLSLLLISMLSKKVSIGPIKEVVTVGVV